MGALKEQFTHMPDMQIAREHKRIDLSETMQIGFVKA